MCLAPLLVLRVRNEPDSPTTTEWEIWFLIMLNNFKKKQVKHIQEWEYALLKSIAEKLLEKYSFLLKQINKDFILDSVPNEFLNKGWKRTILLIFTATCFTLSLKSEAQTLIPQIGVTFSKSSLTSKDTSPHETDAVFRTGIVAGMGIEFPITRKLAIQSGLFYIQKGSKSNHISYVGSRAFIHRLNFLHEYIELPVHSKVTFGTTLKHAFYFKLGANVSYWINGKYNYYYSYDSPSNGPPLTGSGDRRMEHTSTRLVTPIGDTYDRTSRFDISLYFGLGMFVKQKLTIDLGYAYGFTEAEYFYNSAFAANRVIQLSVGMPIRLN